jgi:acyl dehydratase
MIRLAVSSLPVVLLALAVTGAEASRPVPRKITGCVISGTFVSADGYRITVRRASDRRPVDLAPYEGRQVRFQGDLLPGDVFTVAAQPRDLGPCPSGARGPRR